MPVLAKQHLYVCAMEILNISAQECRGQANYFWIRADALALISKAKVRWSSE